MIHRERTFPFEIAYIFSSSSSCPGLVEWSNKVINVSGTVDNCLGRLIRYGAKMDGGKRRGSISLEDSFLYLFHNGDYACWRFVSLARPLSRNEFPPFTFISGKH